MQFPCSFCDREISPGQWMTVRSRRELRRDGGSLEIASSEALDQACPGCSLEQGRTASYPWPEPADRCILCAAPPIRADVWHHVTEELTVVGPGGEMHIATEVRLASFCDRCVENQERAPLDLPLGDGNGRAGVAVEEAVGAAFATARREATPTAVLVIGTVAAGKTRLRKEQYGDGWVTLDPADIYRSLTRGEAEIPGDIRARLEQVGREIARKALSEKWNVVLEFIPWSEGCGEWIARALKQRGYRVELVGVTCDAKVAERRNEERGPDNLSCFLTQPTLMRWLFEALPLGGGPRFDQALAYAGALHRDQPRKGTAIPYSTHLLAVAALVGEAGGTEDEMIAALLHDAVEDQGGQRTQAEIRRRFGRQVAEIVAACSDTDQTPKPPWRERKLRYHARVKEEKNPSVVLVSAADKLHNARETLLDLRQAGDVVFDRFKASKEDTLWNYRALLDAYRVANAPGRILGELERVISALEGMVTASRV
ncbi:MAG: HD domain-containing protein [Myxococcales bacterium]|nr:HD domain-containing protein [Myxococcales bacterium]